MTDQDSLAITGVRTVAVPVRDQQRALDFYCGTLGFEVTMDATFNGTQRWVEVAPPGGATTIALPPARDGATIGVDTGIRLATHDAAADHAKLRAKGADVDELLDFPGAPPMFFVRDADANTLVIVQDMS